MDLTIQRMGAGGDGVAAGPIFVPRSLPGEQVRVSRDDRVRLVRLASEKKN